MSDEARGQPVVTKENYEATLAACWAIAGLAADAPIAEMLAAIERADSLGAILNPTLYREKNQAMQEDRSMLEALEHVQRVLQRISRRRAGG